MLTLLKLTLVLSIILVIPVISRRVHLPSLVGFILAGVILGPHMLGWIQGGETIEILGKMGLLYIMFQAGVEIDLNDFRQYRRKAFGFGWLTFLFPFALGIITSRVLGFNWNTSLLLGAMYGSHTLMTYPIVSRYGVQASPSVNITVGGTMLAITLSLLVLAAVESSLSTPPISPLPSHLSTLNTQLSTLIFVVVKLIIFVCVVVLLIPFITQRIFKRWKEPAECFVLVMFLLVVSALLAEWAGLDGILGAFLAGVVLNRLIPNRSPLMGRINFVGNTIFVPIFLLGIGTMIDVTVFYSGWRIYLLAAVMILTKLSGKWLAAYTFTSSLFTQRSTLNTQHSTSTDRRLIFGLTHATAAGTLAVVTVGYEIGVFDAEILNAAVIMILVLCTLSGIVTEQAARALALQEDARLESERVHDNWLMMSVGEDLHAELRNLSHLSALSETEVQECSSWQEAEAIIERTATSIAIYHEVQPLNTVSRILVAVPRYAEKERDFISCFGLIRRLSSQLGAHVTFFANPDTQLVLHKLCHRQGKYLPASFAEMEDWEDMLMIAKETKENDLVVLLSARRGTISYNPLFEHIPTLLERFFRRYSFLLVYPEQGQDTTDTILMNG